MFVLPLNSREMGQPFFAFCAAVSKLCAVAPGTFARVVRWMAVMPKPSSVFSNFTSAVVSSDSGVRLALPSCAVRAMVKQPAWAEAISSSGFVPIPFSNRVPNEYCVSFSTPLWLEIVPLPSFSPPRQTALAVRSIAISFLYSVVVGGESPDKSCRV
jgi:hypothetical protein